MKGCRGVGVMGRPRGEGIQKLPIIEAFHKNCRLNLLFILILEDRCVIHLLRVSLFRFFLQNLEKWNEIKNKSTAELQWLKYGG